MASKPPFDPVDTSFDPTANSKLDDVESPSLSNSNALARFEFEPGRSKEGTKVLMVEWEDDATTRQVTGDWEISWEGKRTVLPARDQANAQLEDVPVNRLYFLLGAGVSVPTAVTLKKGSIVWRTNPLPAIFPPELGATGRQAGKKGVLHTIWAKKRLQVLQQEIESEQSNNAEGLGLEMAVAEKEWIEQNFGVVGRISLPTVSSSSGSLNSPTSPRTPGGGRLMEKLKGLKIGTSTSDLDSPGVPSVPSNNPLSPESSDVAVPGSSFSSFAAIKGTNNNLPPISSLGAKPSQPPTSAPRFTAQSPPEGFLQQQQRAAGGGAGMSSLNALAATGGGDSWENVASNVKGEDDEEDDLFALPMSPRSPEMTTSPFSFAARDTGRYVAGSQAGKA